jgi:4-hydroxybenzoate polyprenyltransferase
LIASYLSLIKFSHSIFALPFALIAYLVAARGAVSWPVLGLVVVCMVSARAAAMAFNRLVDREIDKANPRTAVREMPRGVITAGGARAFTLLSGGVFLAAAWLINPLCFYFGIPVLLFLLSYSYAKRFTSLAHLWLGVALGLAPVAAWLAHRGVLDGTLLAPTALGLGVALWVMGFDILYACQDEDFDRRQGLHSIPQRFGRKTALRISAGAHLLSVPLFWYFGFETGLGWVYDVGVAIVAVVLVAEHRVITPTDMSRVNMAFFTMNGVVSFAMLVCTCLDIYLT